MFSLMTKRGCLSGSDSARSSKRGQDIDLGQAMAQGYIYFSVARGHWRSASLHSAVQLVGSACVVPGSSSLLG